MWRTVADLFKVAARRPNLLKPDARLNSEECSKQVCGSEYNIFPAEKAAKKFKCYTHDNREDKKREYEREENLKDCKPNWESSWVGALGWSSALVLGWYASQPFHWQRLLHSRDKRHLQVDRYKYRSLLDLVSCYAVTQPLPAPLTVLPPVAVVPAEDCSAAPYGPLTAQQAVDEAAEQLGQAQDQFLGALENSKGVRLMQAGQHKKAVSFFKRASRYHSARAAYNLGVCCEKGLGTDRSLPEAARWYELASSRGHAGAMYNLGVFHARGLGELSVDHARAKQLFESAAELGQQDAARALDKLRAQRSAEDTKVLYRALGLEPPTTLRVLQALQPVSYCKAQVLASLPATVYASYVRA